MNDEKSQINKSQVDEKVEIEGKNFKGNDVISRDFMGRIRKI